MKGEGEQRGQEKRGEKKEKKVARKTSPYPLDRGHRGPIPLCNTSHTSYAEDLTLLRSCEKEFSRKNI